MDKIWLQEAIESKKRHRDYERVVALADEYRMLYTGKGIHEYIKKIYEIEVNVDEVTPIIPPILKSTQYPFNKVFRAKPISRVIDYVKADKEGSIDQKMAYLNERIANYWNGKPLEDFLQYVLIEYGYFDPNAWIITEFKNFNPTKEKAKPYPFMATSAEAIDYEIEDAKVKYLLILQIIDDLERYTLYTAAYTHVFQEVAQNTDSQPEGAIRIGGKSYLYEEYAPNGKEAAAVRVGYIHDPETKGRTYLSMFDKIVPFLKKIIKIDYEGDVSLNEQAFPRRYEYVERCKAQGCIRGNLPDGSPCPACGGTGEIGIHKTAKQVRTFAMPPDKDELIDLRSITLTEFPAVDGLRLQQEVKRDLKVQAFSLMFNADIFDKTQVTATATEHNLHRDNLNDAVFPLALNYQRVWVRIVNHIAVFTDSDRGLILQLLLPKDYKFKTLAELMADRKAGMDAGAAVTTLSAIEDDINEMLYSDRPDELRRIRVKNALNPFFGYSEETTRMLLANRDVPKKNAVLYSNLEAIMSELEQEYENDWIYDKPMKVIKNLVDAKVDEYVSIIDEQKKAAMPLVENPFTKDIEND